MKCFITKLKTLLVIERGSFVLENSVTPWRRNSRNSGFFCINPKTIALLYFSHLFIFVSRCRTTNLPALFVFGKASINVSDCARSLCNYASTSGKPTLVRKKLCNLSCYYCSHSNLIELFCRLHISWKSSHSDSDFSILSVEEWIFWICTGLPSLSIDSICRPNPFAGVFDHWYNSKSYFCWPWVYLQHVGLWACWKSHVSNTSQIRSWFSGSVCSS